MVVRDGGRDRASAASGVSARILGRVAAWFAIIGTSRYCA